MIISWVFLFLLLDCFVLSLVMVIYLTRIIYIFILFLVFLKQRCYDCGADQHMALKTCRECNSTFEKCRKKDLVKLKEKKTNITQQRHLKENRVC